MRETTSEMAIARVRSINSARLPCGYESDSGHLCHDSAFVFDEVNVVAANINKGSSRGVDVWRASTIGLWFDTDAQDAACF